MTRVPERVELRAFEPDPRMGKSRKCGQGRNVRPRGRFGRLLRGVQSHPW